MHISICQLTINKPRRIIIFQILGMSKIMFKSSSKSIKDTARPKASSSTMFPATTPYNQVALLISYGEQEALKKIFEVSPNRISEVLFINKFNDYSGRNMNCSGYQYAIWSGDTEILNEIFTWLIKAENEEAISKEESTKIRTTLFEQYKKVVNEGLDYTITRYNRVIDETTNKYILTNPREVEVIGETHFDIKALIGALETYAAAMDRNYDNPDKDYEKQLEQLWCGGVGMAERDIPAVVAQQICRENPLDKTRTDIFYNWTSCFKLNKFEHWFGSECRTGLGINYAVTNGTRGADAAALIGVANDVRKRSATSSKIAGKAIEQIRITTASLSTMDNERRIYIASLRETLDPKNHLELAAVGQNILMP